MFVREFSMYILEGRRFPRFEGRRFPRFEGRRFLVIMNRVTLVIYFSLSNKYGFFVLFLFCICFSGDRKERETREGDTG
mgnify:CR=1 FL=1